MESVLINFEVQKRFMEVFKFDENDISANRDGNLSTKQKQLILRQAILFLTMFEFVGFILATLLIFSSEKPIKEIPLFMPLSPIVMFTVIGALVFGMYWKKYKEGTVIRLNGKVEIQKKSGKIFLCINKYSIHIAGNVDGLFQENETYNVYYADLVNLVMSVEKAS